MAFAAACLVVSTSLAGAVAGRIQSDDGFLGRLLSEQVAQQAQQAPAVQLLVHATERAVVRHLAQAQRLADRLTSQEPLFAVAVTQFQIEHQERTGRHLRLGVGVWTVSMAVAA